MSTGHGYTGRRFTKDEISNTDFSSQECLDYVKRYLLNQDEHPVAKGVLKRMVDVGYDSLTEKQQNVARIAFQKHLCVCGRCEEFLWEEADFIEENGLCTWCQQSWDNQ